MQATEWVAIRYVEALLSSGYGKQHRLLILRKAGVDESVLADPSGRVSAEQYSKLIQILWKLSFDESLGFTLSPIKPGTFAMHCHAICSCTDLEHALRRTVKFYSLVTEDFRLQFIRLPNAGRFELQILHPLQGTASFFIESIFAVLLRLSSWLIDRPIHPAQITFAFPLKSSGYSFEGKFNCPLLYGHTISSLDFPIRSLEEPLRRNTIELSELLREAPYRFLTDFKKASSFTAKLKGQWAEGGDRLSRSLENFASDFGLSPATLRRKLREEGSNFHDLRETFRKQRAIYYLLQTQSSTDDIAHSIGYSESSTFHRAFKKWTGLSPRAFRLQARSQRKAQELRLS